MNDPTVVVQGILKPDGTLELQQPVNLSPGEVQVTVQKLPIAPTSQEDVWAALDRIWAAQETRGDVPRTRDQIDAEVNSLRDEVEERFSEIERIHSECEASRHDAGGPREGKK
jgi:hypothetical protein